MSGDPPTVRLLGVDFDAVDQDAAVARLIERAARREKGLVVTPNVDHVVTMRDDAEMRRIVAGAAMRLADGMPIVWLSRLAGRRLPARVTGADLFPAIAEAARSADVSLFLLGAAAGVAARAGEVLQARFPGLRIAGTYSPPFGFEHDAAECERIVAMINRVRPDVLFVGVGAPKQEKWAARWMERLEVGPILCVGAAFDFVAGTTKRAPRWMQRAGMEWTWRLLMEPRRMWRRYLVNDRRFAAMAVRELWRHRARPAPGTRAADF